MSRCNKLTVSQFVPADSFLFITCANLQPMDSSEKFCPLAHIVYRGTLVISVVCCHDLWFGYSTCSILFTCHNRMNYLYVSCLLFLASYMIVRHSIFILRLCNIYVFL